MNRRSLPTIPLVLALAALILLGASVCSARRSSVESISESVVELEDAMTTGAGDMTYEEFEDKLKDARDDVDEYLKKNADDVEALILSVRVGVMEALIEPVVFSPGEEEKTEDPYADEHAELDHVLAIEPENAAAHYWKARLYGIYVPSMSETGRYVQEPVDLDAAVEHARIAVELAPAELQYREALALYLIDAERIDEAAEVFDTPEASGTLMALLLSDMAAMPLPDSALYSKIDSQWFVEMRPGIVEDYPQLRVKAYALPMAEEELETFYGGIWEGFAFLRKDPEQSDGLQFLAFADRGFQPASDLDEFQEGASEGYGVILIASPTPEFIDDDSGETIAGHPLPEGFGPPVSYLYLIDVRPTQQ
jgi:hypothetical protein